LCSVKNSPAADHDLTSIHHSDLHDEFSLLVLYTKRVWRFNYVPHTCITEQDH